MALQLYMGNSGSGKSYELYKKIIDKAASNKKEKFLVLVPEQFTMQTQKDFVSMNPCRGIINIDVLSFNRLAYRVFEEVGCNQIPVIDEIGKTFIVRKAAVNSSDELSVFGSSLGKIGLVNEIKSLISEMLQYDIDTDMLDKMIKQNKKSKNLSKKLEDIKIVFEAFNNYRKEKYITSEEILDVLCRNIEKSKKLKGTTFVLDGYTGFTPIQKRLVEKLMLLSKDIYITITFDSRYKINSTYPDYSLFHMSSVMLRDIEIMAENTNTQRLKDVIFRENKRLINAPMTALEKNIFRAKKEVFTENQNNISLSVCKNPLQEVLYAANKINYLIQKEGYRFSDIAIVTGDMTSYGLYIKYIFAKYNINCFVDRKAAVLNHPAASFIRASMSVVTESFSYRSVMRFLRSDFSGYSKTDIDILENYLLAAGINSKSKWSEPFIYQTRQVDTERLAYINELRENIFNKVLPFYKVFSRKSTTVTEKSTALFEFMGSFNFQRIIEKRKESFEEAGELIYAREYAQIYKVILSVLDSLVSLLGDEKISALEYEKLLEAGFLEQKVGMIPVGGDEVLFGDIERSRLSEIKALFVLGANDGIIPKHGESSGVLSELDRKALEEQGVLLSVSSREKYFNQKYYLYLNLTKPSEHLYVSFSKVNSAGETLNPSYLIGEIQDIFTNLKIDDIEKFLQCAESITSKEQAFDFIVNNVNNLKNMPDGDRERFLIFYKYFEEQGYGEFLLRLRQAGNLRRVDDKIDSAVARALYGDVLEGSVTRFEQFARCSYAHFLKYGLMLREREEAGFAEIDFGNIMHILLERYFRLLGEKGIDIREDVVLSEELLDICLEEAVTEYGNRAVYFTSRDKYQIKRLKRIAKRTVWALQKQFAAGKFSPQDFEVRFRTIQELGQGGNISAKMALRGSIDRVDVYRAEDKVYIKVVDYKTGKSAFNLMGVYYGTSLQLMLYLDEAVKIESSKSENREKTIVPAAVVYYRIDDPLIDKDGEEEEIKEEILSKLKVDGLISEDKDVLEAFDTEFEDSPSSYESKVAPVGTKKDGLISSRSKTAQGRDFDLICRYAARKAADLGEEIIEGNIKAEPALALVKDTCDNCRFHSICRFNANISEIKDTPELSESQIISAMLNSLGEQEEGGKADGE